MFRPLTNPSAWVIIEIGNGAHGTPEKKGKGREMEQINSFEEAIGKLYRDERRDAKLLRDGFMVPSTRKTLQQKLATLQQKNNSDQMRELTAEGEVETWSQRIAALEWILANI